jgi:peptide/nickel transport system ATP-binding protein
VSARLERPPAEPLLAVDAIGVEFPVKGWHRPPLRVLHDVSLDLWAGETLGLVGESGSGKSTIGRAILGLLDVSPGEIRYRGQVISGLPRRERRRLSEDIQVVFQDPFTSLNPAMCVADILSEPLLVHGVGRKEARRRVREQLDRVRLPSDAGERYPREFSGGQRQRIAIARALTVDPRVIVCDEPVSSLDLSTQARVLDLLIEIQQTTGVAYLFISHDLAVVRHISHRVAVIAGGTIVESGDAERVTTRPTHPYTQRLLISAPVPDPERQARRRAERARMAASA